MSSADASFELVGGQLPRDVDVLASEARSEGFRFIDTLIREWNDSTNHYSSESEILMTVRQSHELAGIGGVTADPVIVDALRMRRFYVRNSFRRLGLGRRLASALIERVGPLGKPIFVNAGTDTAPAFWESIGFRRHLRAGHTHVLGDGARAQYMNQR